jgi:hypothetical protein
MEWLALAPSQPATVKRNGAVAHSPQSHRISLTYDVPFEEMDFDRGNRLGFAESARGERIEPSPTMRLLRLLLSLQALLLFLTCVTTPSAFGGLIPDPGFDLPNYESPWTLSESGAFIRAPGTSHPYYPAPYEGPRVLQVEANAGVLGSTAFARQTLPASGLQEWTFSGHMLNYIGTEMKPGSYGLLEIVFTGSSFGEQRFSSEHFTPQVSGKPEQWSFGSVSGIAPVGSEQVTFYVKIVQGEVLDAGYGSIWWDEMNATVLEPLPEPASTGWVAILIIGLAVGGQRIGKRWRTQAKVPNSP